jgi:hydroxymethylbilane synthase
LRDFSFAPHVSRNGDSQFNLGKRPAIPPFANYISLHLSVKNLYRFEITMVLRIGTRASKLALAQAQWVREKIAAQYPDLQVKLVTVRTQGDRVRDKLLSTIGGKGLFVKEIEEALQKKDIDIAVHSLKDVPAELPDDLSIGAIPEREDPCDVLICKDNTPLEDLPKGARIGTSSLRRAAQLLHYRPDLEIVPIRGNVDTRIRKLHSLDMHAIIVAAAGLRRMDLAGHITQVLPFTLMLPAIGQGALGLELRMDDQGTGNMVMFLDHYPTRTAVEAERAFLKELKGGCQLPVACLGKLTSSTLSLDGMVADVRGEKVVRDRISGPPHDANVLGTALAQRILEAGARAILEDIYKR